MDSNIGKRLDGRYELLELIGVGGMADIYKAHDIVDNRTVAVKILKTEFAGSDDFLRRFRNESKAIALLSHPNIVKIYDVGFSEYVQFIVMEYIDGINLTEYIQSQGVLKWKDAVHFTLQVLKALQHAHDRGIVHRDIKSQNIMLLPDGTIKVMDFGIARFNRETSKTLSEKAIGSVHYISPEQARGDITDEKSDIYSVGVMLFEMLTGKKPFDGENPVSIALMHMQTEPKKPTDINDTIPDGLEEITLKAMQKMPEKRYQTAGEMITDIEEFKKNPSIVFEYKYFSEGTPKYFDKVEREMPPTRNGRKEDNVNKRNRFDEMDRIEDDYDDYDEEEVQQRRSPLLSILFAVASVFVIMTAILIYKIVTDNLGGMLNSEMYEVPNFVGLDFDDAMNTYSHFEYNIVQDYSSEYPKNIIMRQETRAGNKIKPQQKITIYVSNGPKLIELDDYGNGTRHKDEVITQLEKKGFLVGTIFEESEVPANYVIRTDPEARSLLQAGDRVTVYISWGMPNKTTRVPNFLGLDRETAEANAKTFNMIPTFEERSSDEPEGTVVEQSIPPQSEVEELTNIILFVSTGAPPEKPGRIGLNLPTSGADGNYKLEYYIDGVYQDDMTETRDISLNNRIDWEFTGNGVKRYAIYITSENTGNRLKMIEMEFDFTGDGDTATYELIEKNDRIFYDLKVGGQTQSTTTPATTRPQDEEEEDDYSDFWAQYTESPDQLVD